jgi:hypothetical protein
LPARLLRRWPAAPCGSSRPADPGPTCEERTTSRVASAWQPAHAIAITARFVASERPYAGNAIRVVTSALDRYAARWTALATDACAASSTTELGERRRACLDAASMRCAG